MKGVKDCDVFGNSSFEVVIDLFTTVIYYTCNWIQESSGTQSRFGKVYDILRVQDTMSKLIIIIIIIIIINVTLMSFDMSMFNE
jgi:hypothetical protein